MIFKNPKTDSDNFKRSQRGCCAVYTTETDQNGNYTYYQAHDNLTYEDSLNDTNNKLELVFSNGKLVKETSIMEIRDRLHKGKF
jgi:nicotinamide phosphoribosyltransferase